MRLFSLAQFTLLGVALTLVACDKNDADSPATGSDQEPGGSGSATTAVEAMAQASVPPSDKSPYKRYALARAHIKYEVSGFRRGVEELYFDNWGRKEARYINVEDLQKEGVRPVKTAIITNGSYMQMANLEQKQGSFMTERVVDSLMRLTKVDPPEVISDSIMTRMGYRRQGDSSILGFPTHVWYEEITGTKLFTWKGMVLKQEVKNPQHQHIVVAVSVDTTSPIPDSIFTAPKSIEYKPLPPRQPGRGGPPPGPR